MKNTIKEWSKIVDLRRVIKKVHHKTQRDFINNLYEHLDEFAPFLEQQSRAQLEHLETLYKIYKKDIDKWYADNSANAV